MTHWKITNPDGWDQYTGRTIDYRSAIGGTVMAPDWRKREACGQGIHTSEKVLDALSYARLPAAIFEVEPLEPTVAIDASKSKSREVRVIREVTGDELDSLTGFRFREACVPVHPFRVEHGPVTEADLALLSSWASVRASVRASVWDSDWASVGDSVRDSVSASVGASVRDSDWASFWASVGDSVWASVGAYIGSLFPGVTTWKYVQCEPGAYPFQAGVDLWRSGLVPFWDRTRWRLHGGPDGRVLREGTL